MRHLPRFNLTNLWDSSSSSSSSDEDDHHILPISTATNNNYQTTSSSYSSSSNMGRLSLLPAFPSLHQHGVVVYRNREHLLLANTPRLLTEFFFKSISFDSIYRSSTNKRTATATCTEHFFTFIHFERSSTRKQSDSFLLSHSVSTIIW